MREIQGVHHFAVSVPDIDRARRILHRTSRRTRSLGGRMGARAMLHHTRIVGLPDCSGKQFMARLGNTHIEVVSNI